MKNVQSWMCLLAALSLGACLTSGGGSLDGSGDGSGSGDGLDAGADADSGVDGGVDGGPDAGDAGDADGGEPDASDAGDAGDGGGCNVESPCDDPGTAVCDDGGIAVLRCNEVEPGCFGYEREACGDGEACLADGDDAQCAPDGWPDGVTVLSLDGSGAASDTGNFADGAPLADLSWASLPDVGCWDNPATGDEFFSNQHLAYALDEPVPAWSDVTIELTPAANAEANLYVLRQGPRGYFTPPDVDDVDFCEMPTTFGGAGAATSFTFRVYEPTNLMWGISNRGRFPGDDDTDVEVSIRVTPVAEGDRCYADVVDPQQHPPHVQRVSLDEDGAWVGTGLLSDGAPVCGDGQYLDDAFCVPATQLDRFSGNHVFYAIDGGIPDSSVVSVTVTPDPGVDVSLYGTQQGAGTGFYVPPNFPVSLCESSLRYSGNNPGEAESISFVATTNGYEIFFAVAGTAEQGSTGGFTVQVDVQTAPGDLCEDEDYDAVRGLEDWPATVTRVDASSGMATVPVSTTNGAPLCTLEWASSSQTACFPATENFNFAGNAQLFALDPPPPAGSSVVARVVPARGVDVSLVGWSTGQDRYVLPPFMPSVVVCEASYARGIGDVTNPGETEEIGFYNPPTGNPYNYVFAVAGPADAALAGDAELQIEVFEPPPPHCPESLPGVAYPTWPTTVGRVDLSEVDETTFRGSVSGDLSDGACTNLDFADDSAVACFPATRFDRFTGAHVQYALAEPMPPHSEMTVTLTPAAGVDVNLYGMQTGATRFPVPPAVTSVIACEASYPPGPGADANPGEVEVITFSNPTDNEYNITFVAAGPDAVATGGYTIDVELRTSVDFCPESRDVTSPTGGWADDVATLSIDGETGEGSVTGNLGEGRCTNLDFAADSAVACFPATRNDLFEGNHVWFALDEPMPANSVLTVTLQPDADVDLNLYGLQLGATTYVLPPAVPGAVACEASYGPLYVPGVVGDAANPGEPESVRFYNPTSNPYNVLLGVAGPAGVTSGGFELSAALEVGSTHCEASLPGSSYGAWPSFVEVLGFDGSDLRVTGDLSEGACTNLDWADDSANACFPEPRFGSFEGNHVFYAIEGEPEAGTTLRVTLEDGATDVSLYGYQVGAGRFPVPPAVSSVVACEYTEGAGELVFTNPAGNPYQVFLGVAGASGVDSGAYSFVVSRD